MATESEVSSASDLVESSPRAEVPIESIQPGGGVCMRLELGWGAIRRAWLRTFRRGYVARMAKLRRGRGGDYPHEILDPRDLKYYRNQGDWHWLLEDDPFRWRDRIPLARVGLGEVVIFSSVLVGLGALLAWLWWPLAALPAVLWLFVLWFFRDPRRDIPNDPGLLVAPADGRVFSVRQIDWDDDLGSAAISIDIFLSIFNVHINRSPEACEVVSIRYQPGKFLNALRPEAARENEALTVVMATEGQPGRLKVRQITGAIARRIVCWLKPGDSLSRGEPFGMIKLGSRTELVVPQLEGLTVCVSEGDVVRGGMTVLARFE